MRVRFTEDARAHIEGTYRVEDFKKGQEFDGPFAQQLLDSGCPVEVVEPLEAVEPDGPGVDLDGDGVPEGSAHQILDWVAGDPARAQAALDAEHAKGDAARKVLTADLTKLIGG